MWISLGGARFCSSLLIKSFEIFVNAKRCINEYAKRWWPGFLYKSNILKVHVFFIIIL